MHKSIAYFIVNLFATLEKLVLAPYDKRKQDFVIL